MRVYMAGIRAISAKITKAGALYHSCRYRDQIGLCVLVQHSWCCAGTSALHSKHL